MPKAIMYIGRKPTKWDNKNNVRERVWQGLGQVITDIPDLEANKLTEHPDIWMDVTNIKEKGRSEIIARYQEKYRDERRRDRAGQVITLDTATDEELEEQLRRRREGRGRPVSNPVDDSNIPRYPGGGARTSQGEVRSKPTNTAELAADVFGVFTTLNPEKDLDGQGKPYLERVNEKLDYEITQKELEDIWSAYKG